MQTKIKIILFFATIFLSLPQFISGKTITITSSNPANAAAYLPQGGTNHPIYKASFILSNEVGSYGASFTQFKFVVNGTFSPSDISYASGVSGYKLWINTIDDLSSANQQSNPVSAVTAGNTVTIATYTPWITPGQTYYMWVTADISSTASIGHTLTVAAPSSADFVFNNGYSVTGSLYSGGTQTISLPKQFRSAASGNWSSLSTWQESVDNGATWIAATTTPSSSDDAITIQNGNTVTVSNNLTIDQTTINNGGQITVRNGASLTIADGTSTDLTVNGYLLNQGSIYQSGTIGFNNGSTYQHDIDGGTIPTATWDASSTCLITGITNSVPSGLAQSFGNFTWNCTGQGTDLSLAGGLTTVNGNLTISSTGSPHTLRLLNSSNGANTLNIAGNFNQTGGTLYVYGTGTANKYGTETVNIGGSFNLSGGTLNLNGNSDSWSSGIINLNGNFNLSGGTLTETGVGTANINFTGNTTQVFTKSAGTITNTIDFAILSGATVDFGTSVLDGTLATFTLNSGGTIITANTAGISKSGTNTGSIQVRGSRTYSSGANYVYNGTTGQATGNGWTTANNLTIIGGSTKTLTANTTINGTLTIDNGNTLSNNSFTLNGDIIVTASNNNSTGAIINSNISLGSSITINITDGSPTYDLTINGDISGSNGITKTGNGTILINGGNSYSGTTTISAGTATLGNTNAIANSAPVTMNGGTLAAGYSETAGTLTLTDNSTIALGTTSMNLKFSRSDSKAWTAGKILTITGWQGNWDGSAGTIERFYIGTSTSGLTPSQLSQITFFNSADNTYHDAQYVSGGEIVPKSGIKTPSITTSPSSVSFLGIVGYNSASQFITITGKYLANPITVTAPAVYQLSTDNSTWSSSGGTVTLGKNGGPLYIRYTPTSAESSITTTFTITSGSTTQTVTATSTAYQDAIYVRQNGRGNKDGTSWTNAMATVQNAIETSLTLSTQLPVYVAAGSYTRDPNNILGDYAKYNSGDWNGWTNNFVIRSGVNVYGSFPEYGTTNNNNADMTSRVVLSKSTQYTTTLNGGNDMRVLGPSYASTPLAGGTGLAVSTTWDGFILTGANMQTCYSGRDDACGAGVYTLPNFTLSNCIVELNSVSGNNTNDGGGAEMDGGTLYNCIIRNNTTGNTNSGNAGTVNIRGGGSNVINCLIYGNSAYYAGGGMSMNLSSNGSIPCYIINNTIANNTAPNRSSGIHIFGSNGMFYFYNNAVWNNSVSGVVMDNEKNNAWPSGYESSSLGSGSKVLDASNVAPATTGSSYFPKFANPTTDITADYRLQTSSSLINAGIASVSGAPTFPTTDIRGLSRNSVYDIGCYEKATMYYYVNNGSANNTPNGLSWATPYKTIQDALDMYNASDSTQIWVATGSGSYRPSKNSAGTSSTGSDATFLLKPNLGLYGGFAGTPGTEPTNDADALIKINARLLKQYPTAITSNTTASTSLISYASAAGSKGAILDGFTITGAGAGNYAVIIDNAKIQNCKIISNAGGGLSLNNGSSALNILITNNGGHGVNFAGSSNNARLVNATITNNTGAAIFSSTTTPIVKNAIIWKNSGGNISGSTPTISNSAGSSSYGTLTWTSGAGNIDLGERSPNFKSPSAKNYELLLISPCLDGGDATANSLPMDLNGNPRKYNGKVDLGAFQKWDGLTVDGSYSSYSIKNIRKGYTIPISKLTASNDTAEVLITKGTKFDMGGNSNLKVKWLEIKDSTIVNSALNSPMITNGSITADSVLYVRSFPLFVTGSTTVHAWNFFGVLYPVSVGKLDGATPESSVRIQQYSENTRATNGMDKSAWINLSTSSLLNVATGYSLNLNAVKLPYRQTIIFPSNGGKVTLSNSASGNVSGVSYTPGSISWKENGWNFISNPYPQSAYINYQSLPDNTYWPGTMTSGNLAGGYAGGVFMYNSDGDYYDIWTLSDFQSAGLSPFGACFIKNGNASPTLTKVQFVPEPTSTLTYTPLRTRSMADAAPSNSPVQFRFDINGNNTSSRTYVLFHPNASPDATELEDVPNWSATSNGKNIAMNTFGSNSNIALGINAEPFKGIVTTVPLQVSVPAAGNYTITLPQKNDTVEVYIKDNSGTVTNLNTPYTFAVANASSASNFTLLFKKTNVTPEESSSEIIFVQNRTNVSIFNPDVINRIFVYTPAGQLYRQRDVNSNQISFDLPSISGVYLVKIVTDKGTFTKKVVNP